MYVLTTLTTDKRIDESTFSMREYRCSCTEKKQILYSLTADKIIGTKGMPYSNVSDVGRDFR